MQRISGDLCAMHGAGRLASENEGHSGISVAGPNRHGTASRDCARYPLRDPEELSQMG